MLVHGDLHGNNRRRLALRPDGRLRRHRGAVIHVAKRRDTDPLVYG